MKWSNIWLIFRRELRDQLRDRRTIFTMAVLPILLYPLLGISFFQITQFQNEHVSRIWLIGADELSDAPVLVQNDHFASDVVSESTQDLMQVVADNELPLKFAEQTIPEVAREEIAAGSYDAIVYFPPGFGQQLREFQQQLVDQESEVAEPLMPPRPQLYFNLARDESQITSDRLLGVIRSWREAIVAETLEEREIPPQTMMPFIFDTHDVSEGVKRRSAMWAKLLPFVVLIWALTGAFYPAVDLCAGEKERGTLETLLSSPAGRGEIVWGKLLTIMTFSMATSLLNLASMGLTGALFFQQMQGMGAMTTAIGPPTVSAIFWLIVVLLPISALFSALALAIAAFARSTKEGQYYLMPMLVITLPLMLLPMMPSVELDWGRSLIPVTGVVLLLQELIAGNLSHAARFALPVLGVTGVCCWVAIRWAIQQFNDESVLFRESERWNLLIWLRHLIRDRQDVPGVGHAVMCGILLLFMRYYAGSLAGVPTSWNSFALAALITLVVLIALPAILMAVVFTRNPVRTLQLNRPGWKALPMAVLLAIFLHPAAMAFAELVKLLYPVSDKLALQLQQVSLLIGDAPNVWAVLFIIAVVPAVCEELAFRGFILSGLLRSQRSGTDLAASGIARGPFGLDAERRNKWVAIVVSSFFFGVTHGLLQQSIAAFAVGLVIGYVAVQTRSIWPCILFHLTYNSLSVLMGLALPQWINAYPILEIFFESGAAGVTYQGFMVGAGGLVSLAILLWFRSLTQAGKNMPQSEPSSAASYLAEANC